MSRTELYGGIAALALLVGGCATMEPQTSDMEASQSMVERISGQLTYRERIALPPGSQMELVVSDITDGADKERVISREQVAIPGSSVPAPFVIDVSKRNLTEGPLYGLRAFIKDSEGVVLFRTTSPFLLNLQNSDVDIGTLTLSMTDPEDRGLQEIAGLQDSEWRITQFNFDVAPAPTAPTITFGSDGRLFGNSGCNNFNAEYSLNGNAIDISQVASTMTACEPQLMEQERRFFEVLNGLNRVSLDADGRLILEASDNLNMVAERNP